MTRVFSIRERLWRRAAEVLAPLGDRGGLGGALAAEAEERALSAAMRLPEHHWRRLDRLERARVRAALKRVVSSAGERASLCADADAYVAHARHALDGGGPVPFLFAVGPAGGATVFHLPARDVERFAAASPGAYGHFVAALAAWAACPAQARRELVGELVRVCAELGLAARARRLATEAELQRARALDRALAGQEPAAATDAEVAAALCLAYVAASAERGEEVAFEPLPGRTPDV